METLANQMHKLEDEAKLSVLGILPFLHTVSSQAVSPGSDPSVVTDVSGTEEDSKVFLFDGSCEDNNVFVEGYEGEDDDDDDKFFDAPEISPEIAASEPAGNRQKLSTTSVTSDSDVKEKPPQISSGRRMTVSISCEAKISALGYIYFFLRFLLGLLLAFLRMPLYQLYLNAEQAFLQNQIVHLACGQS